jgi:hypothetical protein
MNFSFVISAAEKAIAWLTGNQLVTDIVMSLIKLSKDNEGAIFDAGLVLVTDAWNTEGSGADKFAVVKNGLAAQFPKVGSDILDTVTQVVYNHVKESQDAA